MTVITPTLTVLAVALACRDSGTPTDTDSASTRDSGTPADSGGTDTSSGLIRLAQSVGVTVNDDPVAEGLNQLPAIWANHLDALEINVTGDWKYREWATEGTVEERATRESLGMAEDVQAWLTAFHDHGLEGAVAINWQGSLPGVSYEEMSRSPDLRDLHAWGFDLETGGREETQGIDWTSADARAYGQQAFEDVSLLIGPQADWLFVNEMSFATDIAWYDRLVYSDAALADFRATVGADKVIPIDPADLAEGVELQEPERYNATPSDQDWIDFELWYYQLYTYKLQALVDGFAAGQADNPAYRGAVWFGNASEVGDDALWLDAAFKVDGIAFFIPENLIRFDDDSTVWQAWKTAAEAYGRDLGAFVPLSAHDGPDYKPGITSESLDALLETTLVDAGLGMMTLYYAGSFDPDETYSEGSYREELVDIWDDWTHPDGPDADPVDWTVSD